MINKVILKDFFKELWKTKARFISILLIVALGCGFFAGLQATGIGMRDTLNSYLEDKNYLDIEVRSNYGLTEKDIEELAKIPGVVAVSPEYLVDVLLQDGDALDPVRLHSFRSEDFMDQFTLVEGRLPENSAECLIPQTGNASEALVVGQKIKVFSGNEDQNLEDFLAVDAFTIVGTVTSPLYFSVMDNKTSIGSGTLLAYLFVPVDAFSMDFYASTFLQTNFKGTDTFSPQYAEYLEPITKEIQALASVRTPLRYQEFVNKIDEAQQELEDGKVEGKEKIVDAKVELADAEVKLAEGELEYAEGLVEFDEEIANAERKLAEAMAELQDGEVEYVEGLVTFDKEIANAEKDLADAKVKLADGWTDYHKGRNDYLIGYRKYRAGEAEFAAAERVAQAQLDYGKLQLEAGAKELADSRLLLDTTKAQLYTGQAQLDSAAVLLKEKEEELVVGQTQLAQLQQLQQSVVLANQNGALLDQQASQTIIAGATAYDPALGALVEVHLGAVQAGSPSPVQPAMDAAVQSLTDLVSDAQQQLDAGTAELTAAKLQLAGEQQAIDQGTAMLQLGEQKYQAGKLLYDHQYSAYQEGVEELRSARRELQAASNKLASADMLLTEGFQSLQDGEKEYQEGLVTLETERLDGLKKIDDARVELDDGWKKYYDGQLALKTERAEGLQKLEDAKVTIKNGNKELADAKVTLAEKEQEMVETIAENQIKIDDARDDVESISTIKWTVTPRHKESNIKEYESNSQTIDAIAAVFPVFFLLIAILVSLTTMTRMVEDQRTQVGTMKALGYSNSAIVFKFLGYSMLASVLGAVIGLSIGFQFFPKLIFGIFTSILYKDIPAIVTPFRWSIALPTGMISVASTTLASYFVCLSLLKDTAANLLRPVAPKPGKRILLERLTPLWKRMTFSQKVTARNLFRYKKRMLMTIVGVAGCAALTLAGFGLQDGINDIATVQFGEISLYDVEVFLTDDVDNYSQIEQFIKDTPEITSSLQTYSVLGEAPPQQGQNSTHDLTITAFRDGADYQEFVAMTDHKTNSPLSLATSPVIVTEKLAKLYGLTEGDTLTVIKDDIEYSLTISGIMENYVSHYLYMEESTYQEIFGETPSFNRELLLLQEDKKTDDAFKDELSTDFIALENVLTVLPVSGVIKMTENLTESLATVVVVLVVCSGLLAITVMYNLTNINISERKHEIATLKVLGFTDRETSSYVNNENMILSIMGALVGLVLGVWLTRFVITTAEMDNIMFLRQIKPRSFLLAFSITMFFTLVVRVIAHFQLKRIDMVESLKSGE